jgi:hypothetical protein
MAEKSEFIKLTGFNQEEVLVAPQEIFFIASHIYRTDWKDDDKIGLYETVKSITFIELRDGSFSFVTETIGDIQNGINKHLKGCKIEIDEDYMRRGSRYKRTQEGYFVPLSKREKHAFK